MKKLNALLFLFSLSWLCGCSLAPGGNSDGIDMEEWCDRDAKKLWTGCWTEVARLDCESGQEFVPEPAIGEFRLTSDGIYSVTWSPFETYVDYAGQYKVSEKNGTIELAMGDRAPPDAEGDGHFAVTDQGDLVLEGIWLGARGQEHGTRACGHRFRLKTASETGLENTLVETPEYSGVIISEIGALEFRYLFDEASARLWEPSIDDVSSAEKCIGRFLATAQQDPKLDTYQKESAAFILDNLEKYRRQYVGLVIDGEKRIWCNLFFSDDSFPEWTRIPVDVDGGGNRFWQIDYIVPKDECTHFSVHGES